MRNDSLPPLNTQGNFPHFIPHPHTIPTMSSKSLSLGHKYTRIRSPESFARFRYKASFNDVEKTIRDQKLADSKTLATISIPLFIHESSVKAKRLSLITRMKIFMEDALNAKPPYCNTEIKLLTDDPRYLVHEKTNKIFSFLNQISSKPIKETAEGERKFTRDDQLSLYMNSRMSDTVQYLQRTEYDRVMQLVRRDVKFPWKISQVERQYFSKRGEIFISNSLQLLGDVFKVQVGPGEFGLSFDCTIPQIELISGVEKVGIFPSHELYEQLVGKYIVHPFSNEKISIVRLKPSVEVSHFNVKMLNALVPSHLSSHKEILQESVRKSVFGLDGLMTEENPDFLKGMKTSQARRAICDRLEVIHPQVTLGEARCLPLVLKDDVLVKEGSQLNFSTFNSQGQKIVVSDLMELLLKVYPESFGNSRPVPKTYVVVCENPEKTRALLCALGLEFEISKLPQLVDFENRDSQDLSPFFENIIRGESIDDISEYYHNRHLYKPSKFKMKRFNASYDQLRGILLSVKDGKVVFDDFHSRLQILKLTLMHNLLNTFMVRFNFARMGHEHNFEASFLNVLQHPLKPWSYYMIHEILDGLFQFDEAKKVGDLEQMNTIFTSLLTKVSNDFYDLVLTEVQLNTSEKFLSASQEEKPHLSLIEPEHYYLKDLIGTVIMSLTKMSTPFYPNQSHFIHKRMPMKRDCLTKDVKFFRKQSLSPEKEVPELFDPATLKHGQILISLISKLKELVSIRDNEQEIHISPNDIILIEVNDLVDFVCVEKYWNHLKLVFNNFKNKKYYKGVKLKLIPTLETRSSLMKNSLITQTHHVMAQEVFIHIATPSAVSQPEVEETPETEFYKTFRDVTDENPQTTSKQINKERLAQMIESMMSRQNNSTNNQLQEFDDTALKKVDSVDSYLDDLYKRGQ